MNIRVMPNAPQTKVDDLNGEEGQQALRVRLHALPIDGKANEALIKWLAKKLGVAQYDIKLLRVKNSGVNNCESTAARRERIVPAN